MQPMIIADIGSCHMGKMEYAKEAIDRAADAGVDVLKFQLFRQSDVAPGNVELPLEWWPELWDYSMHRIPITASVFNDDALDMLLKYDVPFIKFSYSMQDNEGWILRAIEEGHDALVSCDVMTKHKVPIFARTLYCIPEYPVRYKIDFDGLFDRGDGCDIAWKGFDGFSDHTLGLWQTLTAVQYGARIVEKHMKLYHSDVTCPDAQFALSPREMSLLVKRLQR